MTNDLLPAIAAFLLSGLVLLAYRRDIKDARLFGAMRKASEHPYADRAFHRRFARKHHLHWGPCPSCGLPFGGHEMTGKTIPHPDPIRAARGERLAVCPACSLELRLRPTPKILKRHVKPTGRRAKKD